LTAGPESGKLIAPLLPLEKLQRFAPPEMVTVTTIWAEVLIGDHGWPAQRPKQFFWWAGRA